MYCVLLARFAHSSLITTSVWPLLNHILQDINSVHVAGILCDSVVVTSRTELTCLTGSALGKQTNGTVDIVSNGVESVCRMLFYNETSNSTTGERVFLDILSVVNLTHTHRLIRSAQSSAISATCPMSLPLLTRSCPGLDSSRRMTASWSSKVSERSGGGVEEEEHMSHY